MRSYNCPSCSTEMERIKEPDITIEKCPGCGGTFFDGGELNAFATGLSGDIEYNSTDAYDIEEEHPSRNCANCDNSQMEKVALLSYSDVVFDYCPECKGFYLDSGEISDMNKYLSRLTVNKKEEELREYRNDRLVKIDEINGMGWNFKGGPAETVSIRLTVYYKADLGLGLRVFSEKWTDKLTKALGLSTIPDVQVGRVDIDNKFIVQGNDAKAIKNIFTNTKVTDILMEIWDNCLVYTEGPYIEKQDSNYRERSEHMLSSLIELAENIELSVPN